MTKIIIDTNIFIELYYSDKNTLKIFKDLKKFIPNLILTDQNFDEFLRNRDLKLQTLIKNVEKAYNFNLNSSSLIRNLPHFKKILQLKKELIEYGKKITDDLNIMLIQPEKDPIYSNFKDLYNNKQVRILSRDELIIQKAKNRKLIGNPPVSKEKDTIGDEIIWELLIDNIKDDLVILTRDETFNDHFTFLANEFMQKTGKKVIIESKISDAMKYFGKEASQDTIEFENTYKKVDDETVPAGSIWLGLGNLDLPNITTFTDINKGINLDLPNIRALMDINEGINLDLPNIRALGEALILPNIKK